MEVSLERNLLDRVGWTPADRDGWFLKVTRTTWRVAPIRVSTYLVSIHSEAL
jgi:hypothetical protein